MTRIIATAYLVSSVKISNQTQRTIMGGRTRKKLAKPEVTRPNVQRAILKGVETLYHKHGDEIAQIQAESEQNMINVAFSVKIDCSEAEPIVKVGIRIPSTITDSMTARLEDENQGGFEFLAEVDDAGTDEDEDVDDGEAEKPNRSHKKKKADVESEVEVAAGAE